MLIGWNSLSSFSTISISVARFEIPLWTRVAQQKHVDYTSVTLKWHHTILKNEFSLLQFSNTSFFIHYTGSDSNLKFSGKCSVMCLCFSNKKMYGCSRSQRAQAALLGLAHNPTDSSCSTTEKHHLTQYFKKQQLSLGEVLQFPIAPFHCMYHTLPKCSLNSTCIFDGSEKINYKILNADTWNVQLSPCCSI